MSDWYATDTGSSGNPGTAASPWNFPKAFDPANGSILPGDTVWLKGNDTVNRSFNRNGNPGVPIVVRPWLGQSYLLNGTWTGNVLTAAGNNVILRSNTYYSRIVVSTNVSGTTRDVATGVAVNISGDGSEAWGIFCHDTDGLMGFLQVAAGGRFHRMVGWNLGTDFLINPGSHGTSGEGQGNYPIYIQNNAGSGDKIVDQCVSSYWQGRFHLHAYGSSAQLDNIKARKNFWVGKGANSHWGSYNKPLNNFEWTENWHDGGINVGYGAGGDQVASGLARNNGNINNNFFWKREWPDSFPIMEFQSGWGPVNYNNNVVYSTAAYDYERVAPTTRERVVSFENLSAVQAAFNFNNNAFYSANPTPFRTAGVPFGLTPTQVNMPTFASHMSSIGIANSGNTLTNSTPPDAHVIHASPLFPDWWNVGIRNFTAKVNTYTIPHASLTAAGFATGDSYAIHSADDPLGAPLASGVYGGGGLGFPMNNVAFTTPQAYTTARQPTKQGVELQFFFLVRTASGGSGIGNVSLAGLGFPVGYGSPTLIGGAQEALIWDGRSGTGNGSIDGTTISVPSPDLTGCTVLLYFCFSDSFDFTAPAAFTGGTLLETYTNGTSGQRLKVYGRTIDGSEPASFDTTINAGDGDHNVYIISLRNATLTGFVDAAPTMLSAAGLTVDAPGIVPSGTGHGLLICAFGGVKADATGGAYSWAPPAGMSEHNERNSHNYQTSEIAFKALSSTSNTGTQTATATGPGNFTTDRRLGYSVFIPSAITIPNPIIAPAGVAFPLAYGRPDLSQPGVLQSLTTLAHPVPILKGLASVTTGTAPVSRVVFAGDAAPQVNSTSTAFATVLTVPYTARVGKSYALFFFADAATNNTAGDAIVNVVDQTGAVFAQPVLRSYAADGWRNVSGFAVYDHGGVDQPRSFSIQLATSVATTTARIRNVSVAILELTADDAWTGVDAETTITTTADTNVATLTRVLGGKGSIPLIVFVYGESNRDTGDAAELGLGIDTIKVGLLRAGSNDQTNWAPYFMMSKTTLSSVNPDTDLSLKAKVELAGDGTRVRRARVLALDVTAWGATLVEQRTAATAATDTLFASVDATTYGVANARKILLMGVENLTMPAPSVSGIVGTMRYSPDGLAIVNRNQTSDRWNRQQVAGVQVTSTPSSGTPGNLLQARFQSFSGSESVTADEGAMLMLVYGDLASISTAGVSFPVAYGSQRVLRASDAVLLQTVVPSGKTMAYSFGQPVLSQGNSGLHLIGKPLAFTIGRLGVILDLALPRPVSRIYGFTDYVSAVSAPFTAVSRRAEIYESNGTTLYKFTDELSMTGGSVTVDMTRPERRMFELDLDNSDGGLVHSWEETSLWYDKIVKLYRGFYIGDQHFEWQIGEFLIDTINEARFPKTLALSGRDYAKRMTGSKLVNATSFGATSTPEGVVSALALNSGVTKFKLPSTGQTLGRSFLFDADTDRWKAASDIAMAFNYELWFDAEGYLVMSKQADPTLGEVMFTFQTGQSVGNLSDYSKISTDSELFNHIVVRGSSANALGVYAEAIDTNPQSPTRVARIGDRVFPFNSEYITSFQQAQELADSLLRIKTLESFEIDFTSLVIPWLEAAQVVEFVDPKFTPLAGVGRFLLTNFTVPLSLGGMTGTGKRLVRVT